MVAPGLDLVIHRQVEFEFESRRGFYAVYGFIAFCMNALSARQFQHFPCSATVRDPSDDLSRANRNG